MQFYDPLELSSISIWGNTNDQSIAFLRHSEIKHGRMAMAAFVGYIVQSNGIHFPWPTSFDGSPFPWDAGSPPEQWDALTDAAKWQIILFIGFLEWFSEAAGTHYMRGGKPGAYPNFSDHSELIPHPVPLNLFGKSRIALYHSPFRFTPLVGTGYLTLVPYPTQNQTHLAFPRISLPRPRSAVLCLNSTMDVLLKLVSWDSWPNRRWRDPSHSSPDLFPTTMVNRWPL